MPEPAVEAAGWDDLSDADRTRCGKLSDLVWPPETRRSGDSKYASAPAPEEHWPPARRARLFVVRRDGVIVAKAGVRPRRIRTPDGELVVAALHGVLCHPTHRGLGLGRAVVRAAFRLVEDGHFPLSFYQTGVPAFYEKLGARVVDNPVVNSLAFRPPACPFWDDYAMIYPASAPWPEGNIDTLGPGW